MLYYSIMNESLYGDIDGNRFSIKAYSGGGRGSTAGLERHDLEHWNTAKKAPGCFDAKNRGGPLPTGIYLAHYAGHHPYLGECARLDQTISSLLQRSYESPTGVSVTSRGHFFIHGSGPKGSDGCIVPIIKSELKAILSALAAAKSPVLVSVHSPGMNAEMLPPSALLRAVA